MATAESPDSVDAAHPEVGGGAVWSGVEVSGCGVGGFMKPDKLEVCALIMPEL